MDEQNNLHSEISEEDKQKELYSRISRSILSMEIENAKNFKPLPEKEIVNKIVKLIEREVR